jgi:Integrase zinc binding domain
MRCPLRLTNLSTLLPAHLLPAHQLLKAFVSNSSHTNASVESASVSTSSPMHMMSLVFSPRSCVSCFAQYHNSIVEHHGVNATLRKLRAAGLLHPNCAKDLRRYIQHCPICQTSRSTLRDLPVQTLSSAFPSRLPASRSISLDPSLKIPMASATSTLSFASALGFVSLLLPVTRLPLSLPVLSTRRSDVTAHPTLFALTMDLPMLVKL